MSVWREQLEWIEQQGWFRDHRVTLVSDRELVWRNPNSSLYAMVYMIRRGHLIVLGDLGDAIYQWSRAVDWAWLSGLSFDYFRGKCTSSEVGRDFDDWSERRAVKAIGELGLSSKAAEECRQNVYSKADWTRFMFERAHDVLGDDYCEYGCIGKVPNLRCVGHWRGLQLAVASLGESAGVKKEQT